MSIAHRGPFLCLPERVSGVLPIIGVMRYEHIEAAILSTHWAIDQAYLETILSILAERQDGQVLDRQAVEARTGKKLENTHSVTIRDGVAVIPVVGPIIRRADMFSDVSGLTALSTIATDLGTALDNKDVHSILLQIDSPGGEVTGIADMARLISVSRKKKPITAYVEGHGCSAAYWIASAVGKDNLVISPTAWVGSIGVVAAYRGKDNSPNRFEFVSSQSPNKRLDPASDDGRKQIQENIDAIADVFIEAVAKNMGVTKTQVVEDFGKGGVKTGKVAVAAGMAGRVSSFEETLVGIVSAKKGGATTRARAAEDENLMGLFDKHKGSLGLPAEATDEQVADAIMTRLNAQGTLPAAAKEEKHTLSESTLQVMLDKQREQLETAWKGQIAGLQTTVEDLQAQAVKNQIAADNKAGENLIRSFIPRKISPAVLRMDAEGKPNARFESLLNYAKSDPEGFTAFFKNQPDLVSTSDRTAGLGHEEDTSAPAALSPLGDQAVAMIAKKTGKPEEEIRRQMAAGIELKRFPHLPA